jgi:alkylation response protein AidB-like acyl-CoA dehydrogenase
MNTMPLLSAETLAALAATANAADAVPVWPTASWETLRRAGVLEWSIPREFGGQGRSTLETLAGNGQLARACLTTCFILSQREAAVRRILDGHNDALRRDLLPALARDERFATVGLSQLTTSRQHGKPALLAREKGDHFILDGAMPWVTGAAEADFFVTGAVLEDGRQILLVVPHEAKGLHVGPPLDLVALQGSLTAEVTCQGVAVERRWLLAGPAERVMMTVGRGGAGGLETSCLALGLTAAATGYLFQEGEARPELRPLAERLEEPRCGLEQEMYALAQTGSSPEKAAALRGRANTLVLQATQTALTAAKGNGFLRNHPAQRWARQALFFLVWSCPRPATEATLAWLTPAGDGEQVCL